jgi:hypothetical protein
MIAVIITESAIEPILPHTWSAVFAGLVSRFSSRSKYRFKLSLCTSTAFPVDQSAFPAARPYFPVYETGL